MILLIEFSNYDMPGAQGDGLLDTQHKGTCMLQQQDFGCSFSHVLGENNPFSSASQTDLFLNSDLYVYTECNNAGKQLRPPNTLCWPSAEEHPGKLSEQTRLISGRCLWINRIFWSLTDYDFIMRWVNHYSGVKIQSRKQLVGFWISQSLHL